MPSLPFDTLKLARRLEEAGFPPKQAGDTAEALAEAFGELATKADIAALGADIAALRARFAGRAGTIAEIRPWRRTTLREWAKAVRHACTVGSLVGLVAWGAWVWGMAYAFLAH